MLRLENIYVNLEGDFKSDLLKENYTYESRCRLDLCAGQNFVPHAPRTYCCLTRPACYSLYLFGIANIVIFGIP